MISRKKKKVERVWRQAVLQCAMATDADMQAFMEMEGAGEGGIPGETGGSAVDEDEMFAMMAMVEEQEQARGGSVAAAGRREPKQSKRRLSLSAADSKPGKENATPQPAARAGVSKRAGLFAASEGNAAAAGEDESAGGDNSSSDSPLDQEVEEEEDETTPDHVCWRTVPTSGEYVPLTLESGARYYLEVRSDAASRREARLDEMEWKQRGNGDMGSSIGELLRQIEREERSRAVSAAASSSAGPASDAKEEAPKSRGGARAGAQLWVDKYRPKAFVDLLSEDRVNRQVLGWLKSWDPIVFRSSTRRGSDGFKRLMNSPARRGRKKRSAEARDGGEEDDGGSGKRRPEHRIILISGPPGLGKTTLAHIAARHAGYKTVEVNASDDRAARTLMAKVRAATTMQSVLGERRPNCLVIDEIDGALAGSEGSSAISKLVKLAEGRGLSRPIICICNDMYSPALRPLRAVARVFTFRRPPARKLVARLRYICRRERLRCDLGALQALVRMLDADIRACLNMLQFVKTRRGALTSETLRGSSLGEKDVGRDRFDVWNSVFRREGVSGGVGGAASSGAAALGGAAARHPETRQLGEMCSWLRGHGEHERVLEGVHFNYPHQPYADLGFHATAEIAEWCAVADVWATSARQSQNFAALGYVPYAVAGIHRLVRTPRPKYVHFPRADAKLRAHKRDNESILRSFLGSGNKLARDGMTTRCAAVEVLSPLLDVLTAHRPHDRKNLVDTYLSLGLTFKPAQGLEQGQRDEQSTQGGFQYSAMQRLEMEPEIDRPLRALGRTFGRVVDPPPIWKAAERERDRDSRPAGLPNRYMPHKTKENLRRDIEFERVRRGAGTAPDATQSVPSPDAKKMQVSLENKIKSAVGAGKKRKPTFLSQGRKRRRRQRVSAIVTFRFQEGFTNAVRRPVHVRDFFMA